MQRMHSVGLYAYVYARINIPKILLAGLYWKILFAGLYWKILFAGLYCCILFTGLYCCILFAGLYCCILFAGLYCCIHTRIVIQRIHWFIQRMHSVGLCAYLCVYPYNPFMCIPVHSRESIPWGFAQRRHSVGLCAYVYTRVIHWFTQRKHSVGLCAYGLYGYTHVTCIPV